jgi:Zn-dependent protease
LRSYIVQMLYAVPVLLIAFPVHELSHALIAQKLGDPTAKNMGRLTLNPIKHLDPIGTVCLILTGFGWAKPVPINPFNFKNRKGGMALTALAGPLSNLVLGFISLFLLLKLPLPVIAANLLYFSAVINISLCIFNIIPVNPLDGSRILAFFLPDRIEAFLYRYERFIMIGLFLLLFTRVLTRPLVVMVANVFNNFSYFINSIPI